MEIVGYTTLVVKDMFIPIWNEHYAVAARNAGTEGALAVAQSKVSEPIKPYIPWIGIAIDVSNGVCVSDHCWVDVRCRIDAFLKAIFSLH